MTIGGWVLTVWVVGVVLASTIAWGVAFSRKTIYRLKFTRTGQKQSGF